MQQVQDVCEREIDRRSAGRRQSAISAGVQPPSLYADMTGADMDHSLVLITVGRYACCAPWPVLCSMSAMFAFDETNTIEAAQLQSATATQHSVTLKLLEKALLRGRTWCSTGGCVALTSRMQWCFVLMLLLWTSTGLLYHHRSPPFAAFTVSEHPTHGALQAITELASSAVTGAAGLAKTALIGRQDGYRAGAFLWHCALRWSQRLLCPYELGYTE